MINVIQIIWIILIFTLKLFLSLKTCLIRFKSLYGSAQSTSEVSQTVNVFIADENSLAWHSPGWKLVSVDGAYCLNLDFDLNHDVDQI